MTPQIQQNVKYGADALAFGGVIGTLVGWLPAVAAGLSILWLSIQISEKVIGRPFNEILRNLWWRLTGR